MNKKKTSPRFWLSLAILVVLVPLAVWFFSRFDRKYYLSGLTVILLTMAAFFLHFESRKPQARELVILAVLCALAVGSRAAFAAVPHFKPMLAIVILTGIAWGVLKKTPKGWKDVIVLAVFGFLAILVIVGPLLDTSTFFTMATTYDTAAVLAVYAAGVPVNCIHGAAVALTMLLFGKPLLDRLRRIQIKYGMMEP